MLQRTPTRRRVLLAVSAASAVGLAGCGFQGEPDTGGADDDDDTADETSEDDEEATDDATDADEADDDATDAVEGDGEGFPVEGEFELPTDPSAEDFADRTGQDIVDVVTIQRDEDPQFVFDPPFVRVDQGATVRWENTDGVFHTVTSTESLERRSNSERFNSTISSEGDTFEWVAEESGVQHYYCSPHAGFMYGSIEIV